MNAVRVAWVNIMWSAVVTDTSTQDIANVRHFVRILFVGESVDFLAAVCDKKFAAGGIEVQFLTCPSLLTSSPSASLKRSKSV